MGDKNIIFFLLDTVRADDLYYGNVSPNLTGLAKEGNSYLNAVSPGTWTAPAHASIFTGKRVTEIKNVSKNFFDSKTKMDPWFVKIKFLPNNARTLASELSLRGYKSVLFSNNPFLTSYTNLALGFNKVYDLWMDSNVKYNKQLVKKVSFIIKNGEAARNAMYFVTGMFSKIIPKGIFDNMYINLRLKLDQKVADTDGTYKLDRGASDTRKELAKYLDYDYDYGKQFMFINCIEAHENYPVGRNNDIVQDKWLYLSGINELGKEDIAAFRSGYRKRISHLDKEIGKMINTLKSKGILDNATLIFASDHGQLFGEHKMLYHSLFPYEGISKVPLFAVNFENGKPVKTREVHEENISTMEIHNAVLDLADSKIDIPDGNMKRQKYVFSEHVGISETWDEPLLRKLMGRSKSAKRIYEAKKYFNTPATAIYYKNYKLIFFNGRRPAELYDLSKDERETENLLKSQNTQFRRIANTLLRNFSRSA